jgi:hypothetical protein
MGSQGTPDPLRFHEEVTVRRQRSGSVRVLGMTAALVEVTKELVVVIGGDGTLLRPRLRAAAYRARDATALYHPDQVVRRDGEQHHHQQDLQHESSVGLPW